MAEVTNLVARLTDSSVAWCAVSDKTGATAPTGRLVVEDGRQRAHE